MFAALIDNASCHVSSPEKTKNEWDIEAATNAYNVDAWGSGYFSINPAGNIPPPSRA